MLSFCPYDNYNGDDYSLLKFPRGQYKEKEFRDCYFVGTSFLGVSFINCIFSGCYFVACVGEIQFIGCKFQHDTTFYEMGDSTLKFDSCLQSEENSVWRPFSL